MKIDVSIQCSKFGALFEVKGSKYGLMVSFHVKRFTIALLKTLNVFGWESVRVYQIGR